MAFKKKARRKEIKNTLSYDVNESNIFPLVIKNAVLVDKSVSVRRRQVLICDDFCLG